MQLPKDNFKSYICVYRHGLRGYKLQQTLITYKYDQDVGINTSLLKKTDYVFA